MAPSRPDPPAWLLLIHQLPPRPLYLRAKIRRRLAQVGAVAIKNSVYALPDRPDCLEDFQWIAKEATDGGGEACVCRAAFVEGLTRAQLEARFRADVTARLAPLRAEIDALGRASRRTAKPARRGRRPDFTTLRRQIDDLARTDFFDSTAGRELEHRMRSLERARQPAAPRQKPRIDPPGDLTGRTWVTRADPHVDRLATAWLVRRFIDPNARFRFVTPGHRPGPRDLSFDMTGATFTHEHDRCTFETLLAHLSLADPALVQIAEIVHDVDLKDGRFARPDADGIRQLVEGLASTVPDSMARVEAALPIFDALYAAFGGAGTAAGRVPRGRARGSSRRADAAASRRRR